MKTENDPPLVVVAGEILFDLIGGKKHLGGAPFNFAWHLLQLGFHVRFISRIGNDAHGREILERLHRRHFPVNDIQTDPVLDTGTVTVELDSSGSPRFHIAAPVAYDHIEFIEENHLPGINAAACLYFGSLAQRRPEGHSGIRGFYQNMPASGLRFYDINLRPNGYTVKAIKASLQAATILKLNQDELDACRQMLVSSAGNEAFIRQLMEDYAISQVILTRGADGSLLYTESGITQSPPSKVKKMADSVGAGDGFAAMMGACLLKEWKPAHALRVASEFASRICEINGAIPESENFYAPYKKMIQTGRPHDAF